MTDKVNQIIWVFDIETNRKKRIQLQTLLNRANHSFRHENIKYFALEKDRDSFAKECREWNIVKDRGAILTIQRTGNEDQKETK